MTNVVSIGATCEYLVSRAARHRRAGRYEEAMVLLTKAGTQFGLHEEIELEKARVYDEIGCDEAAERSYFHVVRANGKHKAEALFSLALSSAQRSETERAVSLFQLYTASDRKGISEEMAMLLGRQLLNEVEPPVTRSRKARIRMLERKAAQFMQQGKVTAAKRAVCHAIKLHPNAQNYTLLACCCLLKNETKEAVQSASIAHHLSPARVQTLCVLADALMMADNVKQAQRMICIAAMRAKTLDDMLAAAIECAKYGMDALTLRLTDKLLCRDPYHLRAMTLRACALSNIGKIRQASRVFGRLSGLLPEDSVTSFYYRLTKEGIQPKERLGLGLDVPREEGIERGKSLISKLYSNSGQTDMDRDEIRETVMLCNWAMHSALAGSHAKTIALIVSGTLDAEDSRDFLLDLLTDSLIAQSTKMAVLQVLTAREGFKPYLVEVDGRIVSLAAGAVTKQPVKVGEANALCVQQAADALVKCFPDAPQKVLNLYLGYMDVFGVPKKREENILSAALECVYHIYAKRRVQMKPVAARYGVSGRLCSVYIRRILRANLDQTV